MDLLNIIQRNQNPAPWSEDDKIPWHEPEFSRRMLVEHLTQDHDAASRRSERIDSQVSWINETLLDGKPSDILDLGCGPGLYPSRLASLGHRCLGIDFSPAAIQHARERAAARDLPCEYIHQDIRAASYGRPWPGSGPRPAVPMTHVRRRVEGTHRSGAKAPRCARPPRCGRF